MLSLYLYFKVYLFKLNCMNKFYFSFCKFTFEVYHSPVCSIYSYFRYTAEGLQFIAEESEKSLKRSEMNIQILEFTTNELIKINWLQTK